MSWYWWILIYVAGMLAMFRYGYPRALEMLQREKEKSKESYYHRSQAWWTEKWNTYRTALGFLVALWPLFVVGVTVYGLVQYGRKGIFKLLFPRGVTTKFDREQKLLAEKKETEEKYKEAKRLLELEGITVE